MALLRGSSRAIAACLLLVSMWGLPHRWQDDDACAPLTAGEHDESKHVFAAPTPPAGDEHCAVCHWLRSLKPELTGPGTPAVQQAVGRRLLALAELDRRDPATDRLPARAPPAPRV
ncbi:MAG TPA: hypothetical protein VM364_21870 [Vicinamibacterales bacterium]|nr:hypothetical protein [Vicinamibacterales bacterium]